MWKPIQDDNLKNEEEFRLDSIRYGMNPEGYKRMIEMDKMKEEGR